MEVWHDLLAPAIAAAFGTVVGAWLAFLIERQKRRSDQEDHRVTAANTAIFALVRICNDLDTYRRQEIEAQRENPDRWYTLRPTPLPEPATFDPASLAFLFELPGDSPNLPMRVALELERYASIYEVATARNSIHTHEAQPAIERIQSRPADGRTLRLQIIAGTGGERVLQTLEGLTTDLINMIDMTLASIPRTAEDLRNTVLAQFPKRKIIRFEITPPAQ